MPEQLTSPTVGVTVGGRCISSGRHASRPGTAPGLATPSTVGAAVRGRVALNAAPGYGACPPSVGVLCVAVLAARHVAGARPRWHWWCAGRAGLLVAVSRFLFHPTKTPPPQKLLVDSSLRWRPTPANGLPGPMWRGQWGKHDSVSSAPNPPEARRNGRFCRCSPRCRWRKVPCFFCRHYVVSCAARRPVASQWAIHSATCPLAPLVDGPCSGGRGQSCWGMPSGGVESSLFGAAGWALWEAGLWPCYSRASGEDGEGRVLLAAPELVPQAGRQAPQCPLGPLACALRPGKLRRGKQMAPSAPVGHRRRVTGRTGSVRS